MFQSYLKTRRQLFEIIGAAGLAAGSAWLGLAGPADAQAASVPIIELMADGPLPDVALGDAAAPVTIVEYASMTCSHCAAFHAETLPKLKAEYIDTGKVRFILREFPLDPLATAGFMLARAVGPDKRYAMIDLLFSSQKSWAFVDNNIEALAALVKQTGMTQEMFEATLKDQALYDKVNQTRDLADKKFGVASTPTFFINGKRQSGAFSVDQMHALIDPLIKG